MKKKKEGEEKKMKKKKKIEPLLYCAYKYVDDSVAEFWFHENQGGEKKREKIIFVKRNKK